MNEPKDDLLAAFENPDMAVPEMPQEEAVSNTVPEAPVAPVQPASVAPTAPVQNVQAAPVNPTPAVEPQVAPVTPAPAPAAQAPVAEDNQNTMPNVSEEPAVAVAQNTPVDKKDEDGSLKKSLIFIILICLVIAAFIFFLPKIMSFFSGGSF